MNNLYFACTDCKIYVDAGYRWAYWELEEAGIISRDRMVSVEDVLGAENYWNPPLEDSSNWLYQEIFPTLREFLSTHRFHKVVFGEEEEFAPDVDSLLEWMQIGYLRIPTPRYLVEVMGFKSWEQVTDYMSKLESVPWWYELTYWGEPSPYELGKRKFEELVKKLEIPDRSPYS